MHRASLRRRWRTWQAGGQVPLARCSLLGQHRELPHRLDDLPLEPVERLEGGVDRGAIGTAAGNADVIDVGVQLRSTPEQESESGDRRLNARAVDRAEAADLVLKRSDFLKVGWRGAGASEVLAGRPFWVISPRFGSRRAMW